MFYVNDYLIHGIVINSGVRALLTRKYMKYNRWIANTNSKAVQSLKDEAREFFDMMQNQFKLFQTVAVHSTTLKHSFTIVSAKDMSCNNSILVVNSLLLIFVFCMNLDPDDCDEKFEIEGLEDDSNRMAEWRTLCLERIFADMIEEVGAKHVEVHKSLCIILYLALLNGLYIHV